MILFGIKEGYSCDVIFGVADRSRNGSGEGYCFGYGHANGSNISFRLHAEIRAFTISMMRRMSGERVLMTRFRVDK